MALVFAWLGAQAIFLTLVRSSFLIAVGMVVLFCVIQVGRRRFVQAGALILIGVAAITVAFVQASATGGENLVDRFKTITAEDPMSFYYENRGGQVADGFATLLPQYPLGAGLGRWGMMSVYFGNPDNAASPPLWVEIQWPAWIVDGGIPLLILYPVALLVAMWQQGRIAFRHPAENVRYPGQRDPRRQRRAAGPVLQLPGVRLAGGHPVLVSGGGGAWRGGCQRETGGERPPGSRFPPPNGPETPFPEARVRGKSPCGPLPRSSPCHDSAKPDPQRAIERRVHLRAVPRGAERRFFRHPPGATYPGFPSVWSLALQRGTGRLFPAARFRRFFHASVADRGGRWPPRPPRRSNATWRTDWPSPWR